MSARGKFNKLSALSRSLRHQGLQLTNTRYDRPAVTNFTTACEAPLPMWHGAIPLNRDGTRLYQHPAELDPTQLTFRHINSMYCMSNDDLVRFFQEGVGGQVAQLMPPNHPRGFLYRKQSHVLQQLIDKMRRWESKQGTIRALCGNKMGVIMDGATGTGKSALCVQAVHYARCRDILTIYIPNARDWTHGEWAWPSTLLPGFWDAPDAGRLFFTYLMKGQKTKLREIPLKVTPVKDLPVDGGVDEKPPTTWLGLCEWALRQAAPGNIDRHSVALYYFFKEIMANKKDPIVFVVDGINLLLQDTHFRYPHPDFYKNIGNFNTPTDIDLTVKEMPRIPAARLTLMYGMNSIILGNPAEHANKLFVTCTTRRMKTRDRFYEFSNRDREMDADGEKQALDEYDKPFDPTRDSAFFPMEVNNFDEYEYRAFLRFVVYSGELAGLGWGPLWHYSPDFERKLYKIDFLSEKNPQRVVEHYHQEFLWRTEYQRMRQKQWISNKGEL